MVGLAVSPRASRSTAPAATNGRAAAAKTGRRRTTSPPPNTDPQELLGFYRQMLLIRRFEEKTAEMYQRARIGGYCHLNLGEEATCVGLSAGMQPGDYLFTNYREHGYALARGLDLGRVMAELFGREDGVSRGRGGSMHLFDIEKRFMGGYAIVGGQLPLATGAGLAIVRKGEHDVAVCQMGDATTNIGAFHESLNLAALWKLPVVYVVVNNGFGMGTSVEAGSSIVALHEKACAYGIPGVEVDGNDVVAVRDATREAVERARGERIPTLMNIKSYRMKGHSVVDPDRYRSEEYLRKIRSQDPIALLAERLKSSKLVDDETLLQIDEEVEREVQAAVEFADESPEPNPEKLFEFSYATEVPNQPAALPGQDPWA
ncbi:MAG TPA: pyruvate dehydrogenase (acetyl-transferring) E1 component subunit alpha [Chloroflexota bacterium]|jgi:pyruvate dehydrogenase E1 component alpha subunit|nr:pyruvate dehydrogenase (acetyl-transferring) E1 component subunit alpha [Chloroflexota bacterium]